jgi:hypothetical protein
MRVIGNLVMTGQIKDLKIDNLSADPGSPVVSQMWYNTTSNSLKYYDGTAVRTISQGGSFGDFVKHDGTVAMTGVLTLSSADQTGEASTAAAAKGYVDTGLATKQDTITGAATTITTSDLTSTRALVSDGSGKVAVSAVTSTELGYVGGVTSAIQTQIDSKQDDLGYTPINKAGDSVNGNLNFQGTSTITGVTNPVNASDVVNKGYFDAALVGLDFQADVDGIQTDNTLDPGATPATGVRYIITDSGNLHANFGTISGVGDNDIVEYNGSAFVVAYDVSVQGEGAITWDTASNSWYYYNTSWGAFGGLDALTAGTGLIKSGNVVHVNLGAGVVELPSDEVGLDIRANSGLWLTEDGSSASSASGAQLAIRLDGSTLSMGASGIKVATAGITSTELSTGIVGNGLTGAGGTALSVVADTGISVSASGVALDLTYADGRYINTSGDTMTGALILNADPSVALGAVTKQYADAIQTDVDAVENRLTQGYYVYNGIATVNTTHTVNHGMGNQYVQVTVVDENDQVIIPNTITYTDTNNLSVVLSSAEGVRVIVTGLKAAA